MVPATQVHPISTDDQLPEREALQRQRTRMKMAEKQEAPSESSEDVEVEVEAAEEGGGEVVYVHIS
jgi:hypothetical protein